MGSACSSCSSCEQVAVSQKIVGSTPVLPRGIRTIDNKDAEIHTHFNIDMTKAANILNTGAHGKVTKASHKNGGQLYAVKQMRKEFLKADDKYLEELHAWKMLDSPHICRIYETFEDQGSIFIVMELLRGGDLSTLFKMGTITEGTVSVLTRQMVGAIAHIHDTTDLFHGNIGLESWMFTEPVRKNANVLSLTLKMINYGLSCRHCDLKKLEAKSASGKRKRKQLACKAPEQSASPSGACPASDVWAVAVIGYTLVSGSHPCANQGSKMQQTQITFSKAVWDHVTHEGKDFLKACMRVEAKDRPKASELLASPWMVLAKEIYDSAFDTSASSNAKMTIMEAPLPSAKDIIESFKRMNNMSLLEKAAMTAAVHRLPADKISHLRQVFEKYDTSGDGVLSAPELHAALKHTGISCPELMETLSRMDLDGNGTIEYTEFLAATYEFQRTVHDSASHNVFRIFDEDGSGTVTKAEVLKVLGQAEMAEGLQTAFPDVELNEILEELDKDGDGNLDMEEFKNLLKRRPKHYQ